MAIKQGAPSTSPDEFAKQAEAPSGGLINDLVYFMRHEKKWWLIPIVLVMLVCGVLVVLGATGAAPFIYTLF
jgi:hypothetical protein